MLVEDEELLDAELLPLGERDGGQTTFGFYRVDEEALLGEAVADLLFGSSGGDLLVNFNARVSEKADIQSTPAPMYGYGYYGYRGGMYMGPEVQTVRYKVGTANIDVVDAKRRVVVWEGIAERELTQDVMRNPQPAIDHTVAAMFAQFPGRASPP